MDKPRFLLCVCRGDCPGFAKLDIWKFINFVRNELDVEYAIAHPQMFVDDGDRFWKDYAGRNFDSQVFPVDLRNIPTEEAMQKIKTFVEEVNGRPRPNRGSS